MNLRMPYSFILILTIATNLCIFFCGCTKKEPIGLTSTIHGHLDSHITGLTAANIPVVVTGTNKYYSSNDDAVVAKGVTDAAGNYSITFTTNGKYGIYSVTVQNTDYVRNSKTNKIQPGQNSEFNFDVTLFQYVNTRFLLKSPSANTITVIVSATVPSDGSQYVINKNTIDTTFKIRFRSGVNYSSQYFSGSYGTGKFLSQVDTVKLQPIPLLQNKTYTLDPTL